MGLLKNASPPDVKADVKDDADDTDFIDEDLEEDTAETADDALAGFNGPRSWEEVEENESQRVSLSISSHVVPSNDSGEAAARLAWQAAALEAENQDPLGLGRIDAHGLRLVSVTIKGHMMSPQFDIRVKLDSACCADTARQELSQNRRCQAQCKPI